MKLKLPIDKIIMSITLKFVNKKNTTILLLNFEEIRIISRKL